MLTFDTFSVALALCSNIVKQNIRMDLDTKVTLIFGFVFCYPIQMDKIARKKEVRKIKDDDNNKND